MRPSIATLAIALGLSASASLDSRPTDWPRWRGAGFDGTATTGTAVFSKPFELRVRWKRALGAGYSGVVVSDRHAVTMFSDGTRDFVVSLATESGQEEWRLPVGATFPGRDGSAGGPVSTPAIDEGVVFALGPHGALVAVRASTGERLWTRDIVADLQGAEPHWGFTTSPLVAGNLVVVMTGGPDGRAVTAFDKKTGATAWHTGSDVASYQSPMVVTLDGQDRILAGGDQFLVALDPRTGQESWRYEHGGRGFYAKIINPVAVAPDRYLLTHRPDESVLLQLGGRPEAVWTTRELKLNYATPVVHAGLIFGYSGAFLSCIDARTGQLAWRSREPGDGFPIMVDDRLVVLTKQGTLAVAAASSSGYKAEASMTLFDRLVWTPPSFAEGRIFARDSYAEIAAVDVVPAARTTDAAPAAAPAPGTAPASRFARWVADIEGKPDAAAKVAQYLEAQGKFPIVEDDRVAHFVHTGGAGDVRLRADILETGQEIPLRRIAGTDAYYASFELAPDARIVYQFVRGFGEFSADPRNPKPAPSLNYAAPASLLLMPRAEKPDSDARPPLAGTIVDLEFETEPAKAEHLTWTGTRKVHVYLPPGYDANASRRYPSVYVLYGKEMLDGQLAAEIDRAIGKGIEPVIAVFVESTSAYEYARTFRDVHARMMAERLVPWIDGRFRTLTDPRRRALAGADEAGFGAVEIGLRYPGVFGAIVAQSAFALSAGDRELLALVDRTPPSPQRYYVDWGRYDPHRRSDQLDVPGFTRRLHDQLAARGFKVSGREWNDGSAVTLWSARMMQAFKDFLGGR